MADGIKQNYFAEVEELSGIVGSLTSEQVKAVQNNLTGSYAKKSVAKVTNLKDQLAVSNASSALTVTRGAQNGSPITATFPLLNGPFDVGDNRGLNFLALSGKHIWMHRPENMYLLYGSAGSPNWVITSPYSSAPDIHFIHDGQFFEILLSNANPIFGLVVDGKMAWSGGQIDRVITNGVAGATMSDGLQNCWVKIDFGSRATRSISLYGTSGGGLLNIALADSRDTMRPWDRSLEGTAVIVADSFGQSSSKFFSTFGMYGVALHMLGIPVRYGNAIGGSGYARTSVQTDIAVSFLNRAEYLANKFQPDLILLAGGLNDNATQAEEILGYATAAVAQASFTAAVNQTLTRCRAAAPKAIIAVCNIFTPSASNANYGNVGLRNALKADIIRSQVLTLPGPWVFVDPGTDEVRNSSGYVKPAGGSYPTSGLLLPNPTGVAWMTGTGSVDSLKNNGNGDLYMGGDLVHPGPNGANEVFGLMLASALHVAITAL